MTTIQNLSDLQDRRIMMEKRVPPFGYAMILLVAGLLVFLTIWSTQNYRTYVIKILFSCFRICTIIFRGFPRSP